MTKLHSLSDPSISKERVQFLIESSRTSHEKLIFRIKHRDDWLKIQLVAQVIMLALTVAFVVIPAGLASYRFKNITEWTRLSYAELIVDALLWLGALGLIIFAFRKRLSLRNIGNIVRE